MRGATRHFALSQCASQSAEAIDRAPGADDQRCARGSPDRHCPRRRARDGDMERERQRLADQHMAGAALRCAATQAGSPGGGPDTAGLRVRPGTTRQRQPRMAHGAAHLGGTDSAGESALCVCHARGHRHERGRGGRAVHPGYRS